MFRLHCRDQQGLQHFAFIVQLAQSWDLSMMLLQRQGVSQSIQKDQPDDCSSGLYALPEGSFAGIGDAEPFRVWWLMQAFIAVGPGQAGPVRQPQNRSSLLVGGIRCKMSTGIHMYQIGSAIVCLSLVRPESCHLFLKSTCRGFMSTVGVQHAIC